jgi:hypothetical protein
MLSLSRLAEPTVITQCIMAARAAFSTSGAAIVTTAVSDGVVRVSSVRDLQERFRYSLPGAYIATLCGDSSLLAVAAAFGTVSACLPEHSVLLLLLQHPQVRIAESCEDAAGHCVRSVASLALGGFQGVGWPRLVELCSTTPIEHSNVAVFNTCS